MNAPPPDKLTIIVAIVLILLDVALGVLLAIVKSGRQFDIHKLPSWLWTSALPYVGGLSLFDWGQSTNSGWTAEAYWAGFVVAAVAAVPKTLVDIAEKLSELASPSPSPTPPNVVPHG